jgi:hypothetical protein
MMQKDFDSQGEKSCWIKPSIHNDGKQKKIAGDKLSSEDLIRYVEGSLIQDIDRYSQVEEAICNDLDLYNACIELRQRIWSTESDNSVPIGSGGGQLRFGNLEFKTHEESNKLFLSNELSDVSTEDLIRYVDGSLLAESDRYNIVEEAICKNNDLYEESIRLRRIILGEVK